MNIEITERDGVEVVALDGRLVAACSEELKQKVLAQMAEKPKVLFDLSKMTHIDSSGLGVLVQLLQKATAAGGAVKLANLQAHPRIVFDITKVYRVFEIFDTFEAALESFK